MRIRILFQQNLYSRILDAENNFSSRQCFQVEGFDNIPILPSPDSRAPLVGAELPLGPPTDVGTKLEPGDSRSKDKRGIFWKYIPFFKLNSLPDNIPALKPPASLASLTACVGHLWIFQLPGCPWQWDHSGSAGRTLENSLDSLFSLFLAGIPATKTGEFFPVLAQPRTSS